MSRKRSRLAAGRSAGHAHPVDRSLLVFMAVLLLQSAVSIFLPGELPQTAGNIDVVIRTSSAAIFGYFLSANFARADPSDGQTPPTRETHILETGAGMPTKTNAPKAQIGFLADAAGTETDRTLPPASLEETVQHAAGDCMQVQIGQRIERGFTENPISLYRALRSLNPSPYMYFYNFGDHFVVGASPEILVRQELRDGRRIATIRPIAGTRPRGVDVQDDRRLAEDLLHDPKERAEHLMLIDLARNDIGRIAKPGTVRVTDKYAIERYSQVQHLVSHVEGELLDGLDNFDVLKATFPAGTLTGAPKVRAMEIIDELEPVARGIYGGAVGYLSFAGDMDLAIAIRTAVIKDKRLYAQAAAGIVADSIPEMEYAETEHKARAVLRAAELAESGFESGI